MHVRGALLCAALMVPSIAFAQEPGDDAATSQTPDTPDKKADAPVEPTPEPEEAKPEPGFQWAPFGYLRMQYVAAQNDPNVAFVGRDDGFELQNARVGVRGKLGQRAAFVISIDGAVDERTQINVPEGKLKVGLRDAFADVFLGAGGSLFARAGFFHTWVDPESLVPDTQRAFVDKPLESRGVRATEGYQTQGLTPGRSIGAAIRHDGEPAGNAPGFGFEAAVQNGADEFASNNDNDKPAVSLAGIARFANASHVVAAARYNPRTVGDLPFRQDETDLQVSGGAVVNAGPIAFAAGAVFVRTSFPTTGGPERNALGGHGQLMVNVGGEAMPIGLGYRFCIFDPSSLITTDRVMEHTAGVTIGVRPYRMRVQLQATHVVEQRELSNSRVQLAAEISL